MGKLEKKNSKVFFSVNPEANEKFEKYCEDNFISKSKIIEGFMKLIVDKPSEINELLKNKPF